MQEQVPFYPVRAVSRSVSRRNAKRSYWFVLGTGFGIATALFLNSSLSTNSLTSWNVANQAPKLSLSLVEKQVEELSTTQGIDVVAMAVPHKDDVQTIEEPKVMTAPAAPQVVAMAAPAPVAPAPVAAAPETAKPVELIGADQSDGQSNVDALVAATPAPAPAPAQIASTEAPRPAPDTYPLMLDLKVNNGDTLMNILTDTGVSYQEAHNAVASMRPIYDPKKLDIGQNVSVILTKPLDADMPVISSMSLPISNVSSVEVTRSGSGDDAHFAAKEIKAPLIQKPAHIAGTIDSSLYETGMHSGIPANILAEIISAYSYDVDFQRDIHAGDHIDVLFERMQTKEGAVASNGNLLFANLKLGGKDMKIYRYTDKSGNTDYYNEKGESIRKALLRTPINGAKITSGFGMREHPILGYSKMHRGIDFGAPLGTPIYAAGDGTVTFSSKKGGYGNYLSIQHDKKYATAYGHISRFATGIAPGKKVKQGQIVAYVGSTGMSTGPHLHYEILVNNTQVNPAGVKFKTGNVLGGKELASFKKNVSQMQAMIATPQENKVASR